MDSSLKKRTGPSVEGAPKAGCILRRAGRRGMLKRRRVAREASFDACNVRDVYFKRVIQTTQSVQVLQNL